MAGDCGQFPWTSDWRSVGLFRGGVWQLEYTVRTEGFNPLRTAIPEEDPLFFVLDQRSGIRAVSVSTRPLSPGTVRARVIALGDRSASTALPGSLQVPAVGTGDLVLELRRVRFCGTVTDDRLEGEVQEADERVERIESGEGGGIIEDFRDLLEDIRTGSRVVLVVAAVLVVLVLVGQASGVVDSLSG